MNQKTPKLDPLTGEEVPQGEGDKSVQQETNSLQIDAIDTMELLELRTLCKRMACQGGLIAFMTQEETAQAMLDVLAETALKPISGGLNMKADIQSRISAVDKWLDRIKGRPAQSMDITQKVVISEVDEIRKLPPSRIKEALKLLEMPVVDN